MSTTYVGLKKPPAGNTGWGPGGAYDMHKGLELIDALFTGAGNMILVNPALTGTTYNDINDASSQRVFPSLQAAIAAAQDEFTGQDVTILAYPGIYDEAIVFEGGARIRLVALGGPSRWKHRAGVGGASVLTGAIHVEADVPVIHFSQISGAASQCAISIEGFVIHNLSYQGGIPGAGTLTRSILHAELNSSWTGTQVEITFRDCVINGAPMNGEDVSRMIEIGASVGGQPANLSSLKLQFDGCRIAGYPSGGGTFGTLLEFHNAGVGSGQSDGTRKLFMRNCEVYSDGVADNETLFFDIDAGDAIHGVVAGCFFSKAIDDVDNLTVGGGIGLIDGLNGATHGQGSLGNAGGVGLLDWMW